MQKKVSIAALFHICIHKIMIFKSDRNIQIRPFQLDAALKNRIKLLISKSISLSTTNNKSILLKHI